MRRGAILLWAFLLGPDPLAAQPTPKGLAVKAEMAIEPTELTLGQDATLTLTIRNTFNPQQIPRPDLRQHPEWARLFQIEDLPSPPPSANAPFVKFTYRLRPRAPGTWELPRLAYDYLTPQGKKNTTLTQKGLTLTVRPAEAEPASPSSLSFDPRWADVSRLEEIGADRLSPGLTGRGGMLALVLGALAAPITAGLWWLLWRRCYPDAASRHRLRRRRAARQAWRAITQAPRDTDPARIIAHALRTYLQDRYGLPEQAVTPEEVRDALNALRRAGAPGDEREGEEDLPDRPDETREHESDDNAMSLRGRPSGRPVLPADLVADTVMLLERCDAVRFASATAPDLPRQALSLIHRWEAL